MVDWVGTAGTRWLLDAKQRGIVFAGCDVEWMRRHLNCCITGRGDILMRKGWIRTRRHCSLNDMESEIIAAGCEGAEQLDAG